MFLHCDFRFIIFEVKEGQDNYEIYELLPVLLLGVVGGLLGSSLVALNAQLGTWRKNVLWPQVGPRGKIIEVLVVSLLTSVLSFSLPLMVKCQVRGLCAGCVPGCSAEMCCSNLTGATPPPGAALPSGGGKLSEAGQFSFWQLRELRLLRSLPIQRSCNHILQHTR